MADEVAMTVKALSPLNGFYQRKFNPTEKWIWNGSQFVPPRLPPETGNEPWIQQGISYDEWLKKQKPRRRIVWVRDPYQTPPIIAPVPAADSAQPLPAQPPIQIPPNTPAPVPTPTPAPDPTAATPATEDLLFGFPRNYVYIAGAGIAAIVVLYVVMNSGKR